MSEKSWIDSEDGRIALQELRGLPEVANVIREAGNKQLRSLVTRIIDINIKDVSKDREMVIAKAELNGAQDMLKYLIELLEEQPKKQRSK
jgi:hypothetical protein